MVCSQNMASLATTSQVIMQIYMLKITQLRVNDRSVGEALRGLLVLFIPVRNFSLFM